MTAAAKLRAALEECRLHSEVLIEALAEMGTPSFDKESAAHLSTQQRRLLDQIAYHYTKLQDSLAMYVPTFYGLTTTP